MKLNGHGLITFLHLPPLHIKSTDEWSFPSHLRLHFWFHRPSIISLPPNVHSHTPEGTFLSKMGHVLLSS